MEEKNSYLMETGKVGNRQKLKKLKYLKIAISWLKNKNTTFIIILLQKEQKSYLNSNI